jgi:hypothetical protein
MRLAVAVLGGFPSASGVARVPVDHRTIATMRFGVSSYSVAYSAVTVTRLKGADRSDVLYTGAEDMNANTASRGESMLQGMDQSEFGQFVAALWERQGWQTQIKRDDGRVFVAVQRPETGEEGLIWAIPDEGEIGGKQVQQFRSLCDEYDVEEVAIVTAGTVSDHAEKVAQGTGVELLVGEKLADVLRRKELTGLVEQYGGGGGTDGGSNDENGGSDDGGSALDRARELATAAASRASGKVAVAAVVVVALLATGVLLGPSVPFIGGGDAGPISAESTSPANSTTSLHVAWNAQVTDTIDPNESDDLAYYPPAGEEFVIVRMSINNTGNESAELKQASFKLRAENRTYENQTLADHDGFLDFSIAPGQHYVGWTVFTVPEGTTGTLIYDQNETADAGAVEFERDPNFPVNVTQP